MNRVAILILIALFPGLLQVQASQKPGKENYFQQKFRIAVSGGMGYRLGIDRKGASPDILSYLNRTHLGFVMNAAGGYYFYKRWGCGIHYKYLLSKTSQETYMTLVDGSSGFGEITDLIQDHFIGPSLLLRSPSVSRHRVYLLELSCGYLSFSDKTRALQQVVSYRGNTIGLLFSTGIDFLISEHLVIGIEGTFLYGVLSKYSRVDEMGITVVRLEKPYKSNQCSVDLTLGFRFWK